VQVPETLSWLKDYVEPVNSMLEELNPPGSQTALENAVNDALSIGGSV
jgi:hypothetical protein